MEKIIILYGGTSGEHEISLRSAASVYNHLNTKKYAVSCIGIDIDGKWYFQDEIVFSADGESLLIKKEFPVAVYPSQGLFTGNRLIPADFIFPVLHGVSGEDGTVQGLLEMIHIPYAGSGILGSAAGMDKTVSKMLWQHQGLPTVPFTEIRSISDSRIKEASAEYGFPVFIKPARAGSSVGVKKAVDRNELMECIQHAFQFDTKLVIEPAITGREIECSVMGNREVESFPPGEIILEKGFYDYESKYLSGNNARTVVPASLSTDVKESVEDYAKKAFLTVGAQGFARVDFFIEESTGQILLNEINTIPGFTSISMFAKMCEAGGVQYKEVLDRVILLGKEIHQARSKLKRIPDEIAFKIR